MGMILFRRVRLLILMILVSMIGKIKKLIKLESLENMSSTLFNRKVMQNWKKDLIYLKLESKSKSIDIVHL